MTLSRHLLAKVWRRRALLAAPALTVALAAGLAFGAVAQDATPEAGAPVAHPAHIHDGGCGDDLGAVVAPLNDLSVPAGADVGNTEAEPAATSFTSVPMTLDAILATNHAINVHRSAEQIDDYIACGEIGGVLDANGALAIGLDEVNGSGFTGIAYLAPGADGASTDVSVFIAETGDADDGALEAGDAAETPAVGGVTTDATVTPETDVTEDADATVTVEADDEAVTEDAEVTPTVEADEAVTEDEDEAVTEDEDAEATVEAEETVAADLDIDLGDEGTPDAEDDQDIDVTTDGDDADLTDADMTATAEAEDQ